MSVLSRVAEVVRDVAIAVDAAHAIQHGMPVPERARSRAAAAHVVPRRYTHDHPAVEPTGADPIGCVASAGRQRRPLRTADR